MTPKQLRKKREALGLSQSALAKEISEKVLKGITKPISGKAIQAMELGTRGIQPYVIKYFDECC